MKSRSFISNFKNFGVKWRIAKTWRTKCIKKSFTIVVQAILLQLKRQQPKRPRWILSMTTTVSLALTSILLLDMLICFKTSYILLNLWFGIWLLYLPNPDLNLDPQKFSFPWFILNSISWEPCIVWVSGKKQFLIRSCSSINIHDVFKHISNGYFWRW